MAGEEKYFAEIGCLTCKKTVVVEIKKDPFDTWCTIVCPRPECGKLAYNDKTPPPKMPYTSETPPEM